MKKATHETDRKLVSDFQQIVNIGPSLADDFRRLGFQKPIELKGKDPWNLYVQIAKTDGEVHDPCVLDCFMSAIDYMNGNPPKKWWDFTRTRKAQYGDAVSALRSTKGV